MTGIGTPISQRSNPLPIAQSFDTTEQQHILCGAVPLREPVARPAQIASKHWMFGRIAGARSALPRSPAAAWIIGLTCPLLT